MIWRTGHRNSFLPIPGGALRGWHLFPPDAQTNRPRCPYPNKSRNFEGKLAPLAAYTAHWWTGRRCFELFQIPVCNGKQTKSWKKWQAELFKNRRDDFISTWQAFATGRKQKWVNKKDRGMKCLPVPNIWLLRVLYGSGRMVKKRKDAMLSNMASFGFM